MIPQRFLQYTHLVRLTERYVTGRKWMFFLSMPIIVPISISKKNVTGFERFLREF
jgi:hypothetical protein